MKKQIVFRVLICLFVFILVVVGLELIFFRIIPDMKLLKVLRQSSIPGLVYELNPGSKILFDGFVVRIKPTEVKVSSLGLRDREYPYEKPKGVKRLAVLGDSIAFGWGVQEDKSFPKVLEKLLNSGGGREKFEVLNFSVPGYNLKQNLVTLREKAAKYSIDYVLIYFVNNDFDESIWNKKGFFWNLFEKSRIVRQAYFIYYSFILRVRNNHLVGYNYYRNGVRAAIPLFESQLDFLKENKIKLFVVFDNSFPGRQDLCAFFSRNDIGFQCMEEAISDAAGLFIEYDRHPNEKWHQKAAEEIERFLRASKAFQEDSLAYGKYPSGTSNTKAP